MVSFLINDMYVSVCVCMFIYIYATVFNTVNVCMHGQDLSLSLSKRINFVMEKDNILSQESKPHV